MIVLSNNDGCVISRSNDVKQLIPMAAPIFKYKKLVERYNIQLYSSNFSLYGDISDRVMSTIEEFVPDLEIYSVDEAFLPLTKFRDKGLTEYGHIIRNTIQQHIGIPVSIGIGSTKTLAKAANELAKNDSQYNGVLDLTTHPNSDTLLECIPVEDLWGVGRQYTVLLKEHGIRNALQLKNAPDTWVKKKMTVMGLRTVRELRGEPLIGVHHITEPKKGILSSRSFGRTVETLEELEEAVAAYTSRAAEKLRLQHSVTATVSVFLRTNTHRNDQQQYTNSATIRLPHPTDFTPELIDYTHQALRHIYKRGYRYKKAGVWFNHIVDNTPSQLNLFRSMCKDARRRRLMAAVDTINADWGSHTIESAAVGMQRPWKMAQSHRSPRYTTQWSEILTVKATC